MLQQVFFLAGAILINSFTVSEPTAISTSQFEVFCYTIQFCFSLIIDQVKYRPKLSAVNESDPASKETKGLVSQCLFTKLDI